jgi:hypothetical protein
MGLSRITFALLLVMINGLISGCSGLSSVPTPPDSPYPADIIGRVTIANKVIADGREYTPLRGDCVYWIAEVSVRNKEYQNPITFVWDKSMSLPQGVGSNTIWSVIYNDQLWSGTAFKSQSETVPTGQSGNRLLSFEVINIDPNKAQICYKGQEPFSYGELIAGDTVAVYDWDLQKVTKVAKPTPSKTNMATVENIWVASFVTPDNCYICVDLKPVPSAIANKVYTVELYEKDKLRATTSVSWNQPEINVLSTKQIRFPATREEYDAYLWENISHIFSVKVHE